MNENKPNEMDKKNNIHNTIDHSYNLPEWFDRFEIARLSKLADNKYN